MKLLLTKMYGTKTPNINLTTLDASKRACSYSIGKKCENIDKGSSDADSD